MRKIFVAITTLAMAIVICMSSLFGCKLITTNNERDMSQIVATIQIDPSAPKETIYKKDILVDYYSYLYQAILQGETISDSVGDLFNSIVDELVNEIVMVQYAMQYLFDLRNSDADTTNNVSDANKWKVESYLDDEEKIDAKYYAHLEFDNFIKGFMIDSEGDKVGDKLTGTVRVVPTGATNDYEVNKEDLIAEYKYSNNFDKDKYNAFVKALNQLKSNDLLGDYKDNNVENIEHFKQIEENYQKDILLENFQKEFESKYRLGYTDGEEEVAPYVNYDDLQARYAEVYAEQKASSTTKFEEDYLSSISAEKPILKGQAGYGMVYHILLKADDDTVAELEELKKKYGEFAYKNKEYQDKREELFSGITAKDQRSSWIQSHYDFNGTKFTGDYAMLEDSIEFKGTTTLINGGDKGKVDYKAKYRVDSVDEFTLDEIIAEVNKYLYNNTAIKTTTDKYTTYQATEVKADYDKRIKELMFAFSQDDSDTALNTYKGYVIKPTPDATEEEEWMLEFAEAARELIKEGKETFKVVATDYGYHIMFFSENFANIAGEELSTLEKYLDYYYGEKDWQAEYNKMIENWYEYEDTTNYLYVLQNSLSSSYITNEYSKLRQDILQNFRYDTSKVKIYEEVYKDLVSE